MRAGWSGWNSKACIEIIIDSGNLNQILNLKPPAVKFNSNFIDVDTYSLIAYGFGSVSASPCWMC